MVDVANAAVSHRSWDREIRSDSEVYDKWPVWARLVVIIGLSGLLWAGIISAVVTLLG